MSIYFKNQLWGYSVVTPILEALSKDICIKCIGLGGAKIKVIKGLKKLKIDLENSSLPEGERAEIAASIRRLSEMAEVIDVAEETTCQKTAGNCKIGQACLPLDGAWGLMKQITEPAILTVVANKTVDVRSACCPDTLVTLIKDAMKGMESGGILEVFISQDLKDIFNKFVEKEKCSIIDISEKGGEASFKVKIK